MRITITTTGVEETIAELDRRLELRDRAVEAALDRWGQLVTQEMKDTHEFINRTFHLEMSIGSTLHPFSSTTDHSARLDVVALADYAEQVEFGHPGPPPARPYPFFWPVYYNHEPQLYDDLNDAVQQTMDFGRAP